MTFDYEKVIAYKCNKVDCKVVRKTISDIEEHIHLAHGLPYEFIIRPTLQNKGNVE